MADMWCFPDKLAVRRCPLLFFLAAALAFSPEKAVSGLVFCDNHNIPLVFPQLEDGWKCPECHKDAIPIPQDDHYAKWNDSSWRVLRNAAKHKKGNHVLATQSLFQTTTLLGAGARGRTQGSILGVMGATQKTFREFSRIVRSGSREYGGIISQANVVVVSNKNELRQEYLQFLRQHDGNIQIETGVNLSNPQVASEVGERVNNEVCKVTNGMIEKCLDPGKDLNAATVMLIANASHFQGTWAIDFEEFNGQFKVPGRQRPTTVEMIAAESRDIQYALYEGWQAVSIPYQEKAEMVVILPPEGIEPDAIDDTTYHALLNKLQQQYIYLKMPKYLLEMEYSMEDIFNREEQDMFSEDADFGDMVQTLPLFVSSMKHKVKIRTDKKGTQAAGGAFAIMSEGERVTAAQEVDVNRPFWFGIRDSGSQGAFRFVGQIFNPIGGG